MKMRTCAVAGMFYPNDPSHLEQLLEKFFSVVKPGKKSPLGIVSPHAGYIYSGQVAANAFGAIPPDFSGTFVVIGPSHRGYLSSVSSIPWETPLGVVDPDREFIEALELETDELSHKDEHSIEVQLPFLHRFRPDVRIVPVALGRLSLEECRALGEGAADAIAGDPERPLLVASTDMSHYVPDAVARKKDRLAIERMLALDPEGLYTTVRVERISMCGVLPATVVLFAARRLGATSARLVRYATSGDVSRDFEQVVGYAGLAFR